MDKEEFRKQGHEIIDYLCGIHETLREKDPFPAVSPGYMKGLIPPKAPFKPDKWEDVKEDVGRVYVPGVNWCLHPRFAAYYTLGFSYPSVLGSLASCPAATELEVTMMNWLAEAFKLPKVFFFTENGKGGGLLQSSSCESVIMALLSARTVAIESTQSLLPHMTKGEIVDKLVAYTSEEAHSSVERAALIGLVKMRHLPTDEKGSLRGKILESAVKEDINNGLLPFFVCATVGTTSTCAVDNLRELGPLCEKYSLWFHLDAAYAGAACVCPEYRYLFDGVEYCASLAINMHKMMMTTHPCAAMWFKDSDLIGKGFSVDPVYLQHPCSQSMPVYRNWNLSLVRDCKALKVWFVFRLIGIKGLQEFIRERVARAKELEALVLKDSKFEIVREVTLGLVCFRLKGPNIRTEKLNKIIREDNRIEMTPSSAKEIFFLRYTPSVTAQFSDVVDVWTIIQEKANKICKEFSNEHYD